MSATARVAAARQQLHVVVTLLSLMLLSCAHPAAARSWPKERRLAPPSSADRGPSPGDSDGDYAPGDFSSSSSSYHQGPGRPRLCQPVTIPMCHGIGYNSTYMPNQFNHFTQEEAGLEVHQFWPLVHIRCSVDLQFFLCSLYAPICIPDYEQPLPACRAVCERAKAGCAPLMRQYGFAWPAKMDCDQFPEHGNDEERLCMDNQDYYTEDGRLKEQYRPVTTAPGGPPGPAPAGEAAPRLYTSAAPGWQVSSTRRLTSDRLRVKQPRKRPDDELHQEHQSIGSSSSASSSSAGCSRRRRRRRCSCDPTLGLVPLNTSDRLFGRGLVTTGGLADCAMGCRSAYFADDPDPDWRARFTDAWLASWAALCLLSTGATLATFALEPARFAYPARPIIYLSVCYAMVSLGYLLRVGLGHQAVACELAAGGRWMARYSTTGGAGGGGGPWQCLLVFLLTYYFGMASALCWCLLALAWLLAAGLQWAPEAIAAHGAYFQLGVWLPPAVQTVAVLASGAVDADPVSGLCGAGGLDAANLRGFVIAPLVTYLLLGTSFLLLGLVSLFRIRTTIKGQQRQHQTRPSRQPQHQPPPPPSPPHYDHQLRVTPLEPPLDDSSDCVSLQTADDGRWRPNSVAATSDSVSLGHYYCRQQQHRHQQERHQVERPPPPAARQHHHQPPQEQQLRLLLHSSSSAATATTSAGGGGAGGGGPASSTLGTGGVSARAAPTALTVTTATTTTDSNANSTNRRKLEKLMIRIGVFSILYTVPATALIGCHLYQQYHQQDWQQSLTCPCRQQPRRSRPDFSVFMARHLMCLLMGCVSVVWICNRKTLSTWRRLLCRPFAGRTYPASPAAAAAALMGHPVRRYYDRCYYLKRGYSTSNSLKPLTLTHV